MNESKRFTFWGIVARIVVGLGVLWLLVGFVLVLFDDDVKTSPETGPNYDYVIPTPRVNMEPLPDFGQDARNQLQQEMNQRHQEIEEAEQRQLLHCLAQKSQGGFFSQMECQ